MFESLHVNYWMKKGVKMADGKLPLVKSGNTATVG